VRRRASREARKAAQGKQDGDAVESGVGRRDALDGARTPATRAVATTQSPVPATRRAEAAPAKASRKAAPADDDDMKDIEDILRKRGI